MNDNTQKKIDFEIAQIDKLLRDASPLIQLCENESPDFIGLCAVGTILHSFYNGIENIFALCAKAQNFEFKSKAKWHSELFEFSAEKFSFDETTRETLLEYMSFRHFYRHSYGFALQWEKCARLFTNIENVWSVVKNQIRETLRAKDS